MRVLIKQSFLTGVAFALVFSSASAQFHSKSKAGEARVNQQAVNTANQQAAALMSAQGNGGAQVGANQLSTLYVSEAQRRQFGAAVVPQQQKMVHVWGRAIHHSDGTYTESKQDELTNTLEQVTKSKNGTKLQRRMVMLDDRGRPSEIMIYDGRETFKYRGVQIYDTFGRFSEEQLYDAKGTLIRRKVQEYDPRGKKLPVRSWDYVANVPADLKLVITRESEDPTREQTPPEKQRNGLFGKKESTAPAPDGEKSQGNSAAPEKRKGLSLGRIFGGSKREK